MIILGIDPGSRITGFGLVDNQANRLGYIAEACRKLGQGTLCEGSGAHTTSVAFKKPQAEFVFQPLDLLAQRRLRNMQALGCPALS